MFTGFAGATHANFVGVRLRHHGPDRMPLAIRFPAALSHRVAAHLNAMCVENQPIEDAIGQRRDRQSARASVRRVAAKSGSWNVLGSSPRTSPSGLFGTYRMRWLVFSILDGVRAEWTAVVVPVGIFGSGLVIGWLWVQTESIWIAAIAHGALNNWGQYAFKFVSDKGGPNDLLVLGIGGIALTTVGTILLFRKP